MNHPTVTSRLELLSNAAASAIARDETEKAQVYTVAMRQVLEAHPRIKHKATWWEIHEAHADACGA